MNKSESITKLAAALAKAQAEMPVVKMNKQNPFLKNKYADLGAVIEASRPVLAKHELSIAQFPTGTREVGVTTILMHSSGEWISDTLTLPLGDSKGLSDSQSAGVVISYLRRYSWASVLGLYSDEDTDGHQPRVDDKRSRAIEKYNDLAIKANELALEVYEIADNMTYEEIVEAGKELKSRVEGAK